MDFNHRVLQLAEDAEHAAARAAASFCAIYANNLDEFFMVRVAGLVDHSAARHDAAPTAARPSDVLHEIAERVRALEAELEAILHGSSCCRRWPPRASASLTLAECTAAERAHASTEMFEQEIFPVLTPLAVGPGRPFPYISNLSLSLGVFVVDPPTGEQRFARVKVPEVLPRVPGARARARATSRSRT